MYSRKLSLDFSLETRRAEITRSALTQFAPHTSVITFTLTLIPVHSGLSRDLTSHSEHITARARTRRRGPIARRQRAALPLTASPHACRMESAPHARPLVARLVRLPSPPRTLLSGRELIWLRAGLCRFRRLPLPNPCMLRTSTLPRSLGAESEPLIESCSPSYTADRSATRWRSCRFSR